MNNTLPLSRFKVLDLTTARSGPAAVRQLADWGADVVMVEPPGNDGDIIGKRDSADFQNLHRNKRSITVDLKTEQGKNVLFALAKEADVMIENMRPEVKHRLGIDYDTMKQINPRLVYASISGFGQDGPYANRPGLDQIVQGMGGLMSITGYPDSGPLRVGIAITDLSAGLFCAFGVLMALLDREHTQKGQWIRTSLLQAQIAMLDFQAVRWLVDEQVPQREGNHHPTFAPMGLFETADGQVNMAAAGQKMFEKFCRLSHREDWITDVRFKNSVLRYENREIMRTEVQSVMRQRTSADWIESCNAAGVPCGPVYTIDEMFSDPQVEHLKMTLDAPAGDNGTIELVAQPLDFADMKAPLRVGAPGLGEHTERVLQSAGYTAPEIAKLKSQGII
jgi:crotonobetainyl-CoA:carnitine CoA-transferase CaiB-like acyl-CoA transferase